jgi:hypothetical protein
MAQLITAMEVIKAARKAYKENRLGAQHHDTCRYSYEDGIRCAVGVAMTENTIDLLREGMWIKNKTMNQCAIDSDRMMPYIKIVNKAELQAIKIIQEAHDDWACERNDDERSLLERNFLGELDIQESKLKEHQ